MQSNRLIFKFNYHNHFNAFEALMSSSKHVINFYFISNFVFIKFLDFFNRFILFNRDQDRRSEKIILRKTLNSQSNNLFSLRFNMITKISTLSKSLNKLKTSTNIVMIKIVVFCKLNFQKNKTANVKCYFMTIFKINNALLIYRV